MSTPVTEMPPYRRARIVPPAPATTSRPRRRGLTPLEIFLFAVFAGMVVLGAMAIYSSRSSKYDFVPNTVAEGIRRDRVNVLLIGVGGDAHPGKDNLADSVILLSLKPSTRQAALVSIPRDFQVTVRGHGEQRLNESHLLGEQISYPGRGPGMVVDRVREITGQPVDAYARLDFAAFERIIDALGGIDVYVYRPFRDYLFKDTFQQGWQHMDGKRALRFARYRYVIGAEGNTYARELRQQQILSAVRTKLQKMTAAQALRLAADAGNLTDYTKTNLTPMQMVQLYRLFRNMSQGDLRHVSLRPFTDSITSPGANGEVSTIIVPKGGDARPLRATIGNVFSDMNPVAAYDQIQIKEGVEPAPAQYAGDDSFWKRRRAK